MTTEEIRKDLEYRRKQVDASMSQHLERAEQNSADRETRLFHIEMANHCSDMLAELSQAAHSMRVEAEQHASLTVTDGGLTVSVPGDPS